MESKIRSKYVTPQVNLNWWKVEIDSGCLTERDGKIKKFGTWFSSDEMKNVEALTVFDRYSEKSDSHAFSKFSGMSGFENLKFLSIPLDLMNTIDIKGISKILNTSQFLDQEFILNTGKKTICQFFLKKNCQK